MYGINACWLEGDRPLVHDGLCRVATAVDVHHAKYFVAGFEPGAPHFSTPPKSPDPMCTEGGHLSQPDTCRIGS
jgi:hypothetical protein